MEKGKLMKVQDAEAIALSPEVKAALGQMGEIMRSMADMLRATNERMASLEREVRLMTKVTPAQANAINEAIRQRAGAMRGVSGEGMRESRSERDPAGRSPDHRRQQHPGIATMRICCGNGTGKDVG